MAAASAYFYQLLLKQAQLKYNAVQDSDYPQIIINSLSLEGSSELGIEDNDLIITQLQEGIKDLERAEAQFIVIPCNSVHHTISELRKSSKVPVISIIEEVSKKVESSQFNKVLLLSSETTNKHGLYDNLQNKGIEIIEFDEKEQKYINDLILNVMSGKDFSNSKSQILEEIESLASTGKIDSIILGCTELPIAIHSIDTSVKLFDSLKILADSALDFSKTN